MKYTYTLLIFSLLLIGGCATTVSESGLFWGNYSKTLYEYKKNPSPENLAKHKNELQTILSKSKEMRLRPPPGIQAELGAIYMNEKDQKTAMNYFSLEAETYPESKILITRLMDIVSGKKEKK